MTKNAVSRVNLRFCEAFAARDWDSLADCFDTACDGRDGRTGLGNAISGRDQVVVNMRAAASVGAVEIDHTVLATRGERVELGRFIYRTSHEDGGLEVETVQVTAVNEDGRISRFLTLDADDIEPGLRLLDGWLEEHRTSL